MTVSFGSCASALKTVGYVRLKSLLFRERRRRTSPALNTNAQSPSSLSWYSQRTGSNWEDVLAELEHRLDAGRLDTIGHSGSEVEHAAAPVSASDPSLTASDRSRPCLHRRSRGRSSRRGVHSPGRQRSHLGEPVRMAPLATKLTALPDQPCRLVMLNEEAGGKNVPCVPIPWQNVRRRAELNSAQL
jgi:hypothetical protein